MYTKTYGIFHIFTNMKKYKSDIIYYCKLLNINVYLLRMQAK